MEHTDEKPAMPESPNTHKRIMARNRMRRYRLRQKQNQQARNQAGTMVFTLPPQSPIIYSDMMPAANVGPPQVYQPPPIEGYDAPIMPPHSTHMTPQMTPPQMHQAPGPSQLQGAPSASQLNQYRQIPYQQPQNPLAGMVPSTRNSSPPPGSNPGLMPPMPPMPPARDPDSAPLQALHQAIDSLSINTSRPVNTSLAVQDIVHTLPMRSDQAESIEFAARLIKILAVHLA